MTGRGGRAYSFLANPLSGGGAAPAALVPIARILRDAGASVDVTYSPGLSATLEVVDTAVARGEVVVSVGGDGMLSSIAGRVSTLGGTLGIIPAGRGNDFARMLGLPTAGVDIAKILLEGTPRPVDLLALRLGGAPRIVTGSVYLGVDAVASEVVDKVRWLPRRLQYPYAAVHAFATYDPVTAEVVVDDGEPLAVRAATVVIANSGYYGSGMHIAPTASLDDGLLDVVVIEATRRGLIRSLPKVYDGSHLDLPGVHVLRGRSVTVSGTPAVPIGGDGEPLGHLPASGAVARTDILPGALNLLRSS